jgi:hypothetical protein
MSCNPAITVKLPVCSVFSIFGRTGTIQAQAGDYNTDLVTEGDDNLYYTIPRSFNSFANSASVEWTYNGLTEKITATVTTASVISAINGANINPNEVRPSGDILFNSSADGVILTAPNGTKYKISVNNAGVLSTSVA